MRFKAKISEREHRENLFCGLIDPNHNKKKKLAISSPFSQIIFSSTNLEMSHILIIFIKEASCDFFNKFYGSIRAPFGVSSFFILFKYRAV